MKMMTMATISPATYSACPCPNGCSLSALRPAILKPSSVMTDEPASERLLKASAVMAMEWESSPARYLAANKSIFKPMPTAPQSMPYTRRTPGSSNLSGSSINIFARKRIMSFPPSVLYAAPGTDAMVIGMAEAFACRVM